MPITLICPRCGINEVRVDMTLDQVRGMRFEDIPDCNECATKNTPPELKPIHTGLLEAAEKRKEICKFGFVVNCPQCHVKQISAYDKIYTFAYQRCVDCTPADELEAFSDAIFQIVGGI